jgi:hypothetical protein
MNGRRECDTSPCKTTTETNHEITEKMLLHPVVTLSTGHSIVECYADAVGNIKVGHVPIGNHHKQTGYWQTAVKVVGGLGSEQSVDLQVGVSLPVEVGESKLRAERKKRSILFFLGGWVRKLHGGDISVSYSTRTSGRSSALVAGVE